MALDARPAAEDPFSIVNLTSQPQAEETLEDRGQARKFKIFTPVPLGVPFFSNIFVPFGPCDCPVKEQTKSLYR